MKFIRVDSAYERGKRRNGLYARFPFPLTPFIVCYILAKAVSSSLETYQKDPRFPFGGFSVYEVLRMTAFRGKRFGQDFPFSPYAVILVRGGCKGGEDFLGSVEGKKGSRLIETTQVRHRY